MMTERESRSVRFDPELNETGRTAVRFKSDFPTVTIHLLPEVDQAVGRIRNAYERRGIEFRSVPAMIEHLVCELAEIVS